MASLLQPPPPPNDGGPLESTCYYYYCIYDEDEPLEETADPISQLHNLFEAANQPPSYDDLGEQPPPYS